MKNNYYKVHLNKRRRKSIKSKGDYKRAQLILIMVMGALKISSIQSQVFKSKALRYLEILNSALETQQQVKKMFSKKQKYLNRIKK